MDNLVAVPTDHGLSILSGSLKNTVTKFQLHGAQTIDETKLHSFYESSIHASYYDDNSVLTFEMRIPTETHFDEYMFRVVILDNDGEVVITCDTPKVALPIGVGGMLTLKATITGKPSEIIFKQNDYVTVDEVDVKVARTCPIGVILPWMSDIPPDGWTIMKGQAFDTSKFTKLAKIYPNGVIPDMRGLGVIGTNTGEQTGDYEEGQVKSHTHTGTVNSTDLGSKTAVTSGSHVHATYNSGRDNGANDYDGTYTSGSRNPRGTYQSPYNTSASGNHSHSVPIGAHGHTITINSFGAHKNTIDHRKVNWIVRMA